MGATGLTLTAHSTAVENVLEVSWIFYLLSLCISATWILNPKNILEEQIFTSGISNLQLFMWITGLGCYYMWSHCTQHNWWSCVTSELNLNVIESIYLSARHLCHLSGPFRGQSHIVSTVFMTIRITGSTTVSVRDEQYLQRDGFARPIGHQLCPIE